MNIDPAAAVLGILHRPVSRPGHQLSLAPIVQVDMPSFLGGHSDVSVGLGCHFLPEVSTEVFTGREIRIHGSGQRDKRRSS